LRKAHHFRRSLPDLRQEKKGLHPWRGIQQGSKRIPTLPSRYGKKTGQKLSMEEGVLFTWSLRKNITPSFGKLLYVQGRKPGGTGSFPVLPQREQRAEG